MSYAPNYIRQSHPIITRLRALFMVLTNRNIIVITLKETSNGHTLRTLYRTDVDAVSEILALQSVITHKLKSGEVMFSVGDTISWTLSPKTIAKIVQSSSTNPSGIYSSIIQAVDKEAQYYSVYTSYGPDHIPFLDATLVKLKD